MRKRLTVIGGGPGGYVAAIRAAQLGAEVHLVEQQMLGGTCLNVGCIPTKTLLHTAKLFQAVLAGAKNGLVVENARVDWPALQRRKAAVVKRLVMGVGALLKANNVTVHLGRAALRDARTVRVEGSEPITLTSDAIILAVGSVPLKLKVPGADLAGVIDSTVALSLPQVPSSMTIVGGGVIGTEFAALYKALGAKVTVIELLPEILPQTDRQIAALIRRQLSRDGIRFLTESKLTEIKVVDNMLVAKAIVQGGEHETSCEKVLIAVGRRPNTENIGLESAGINTERGAIVVDSNFATNIPGIYAIGDCNGKIMLAHAASAQGITAVEHTLSGRRPVFRSDVVPNCIYTSPEVAGVGLTEEQAKDRRLAYKTGLFPLAGNAKALIEGGETGLVKIIAGDEYGEILGVHMVGPRATDVIGEASLAMALERTVEDIVSAVHAHPTISEAMTEAAHDVLGTPIHWPPGVGMGLPTK